MLQDCVRSITFRPHESCKADAWGRNIVNKPTVYQHAYRYLLGNLIRKVHPINNFHLHLPTSAYLAPASPSTLPRKLASFKSSPPVDWPSFNFNHDVSSDVREQGIGNQPGAIWNEPTAQLTDVSLRGPADNLYEFGHDYYPVFHYTK
jgi:hypothetical protein